MTETQTPYNRIEEVEMNDKVVRARAMFSDIDRMGPTTELVRFMQAMSLLYIDDPHMKVLRLAAIIHETMPRTIKDYNGIK